MKIAGAFGVPEENDYGRRVADIGSEMGLSVCGYAYSKHRVHINALGWL